MKIKTSIKAGPFQMGLTNLAGPPRALARQRAPSPRRDNHPRKDQRPLGTPQPQAR